MVRFQRPVTIPNEESSSSETMFSNSLYLRQEPGDLDVVRFRVEELSNQIYL